MIEAVRVFEVVGFEGGSQGLVEGGDDLVEAGGGAGADVVDAGLGIVG